MGGLYTEPDRLGIRKTAPTYVTFSAATTPAVIWNTTPTRTAIIRKIMVASSDSGNCQLEIGTGTGGSYAQTMPSLYVIAGQDTEYDEDHIPNQEFGVPITAQISAHTTGAVTVLVEVEEYEGSTNHA